MVTKKDEYLAGFSLKFSKIVSKLGNLGAKLWKKDVVCNVLLLIPPRYDPLTLSIEYFNDLSTTSLKEVTGSWKVHELKLLERGTREED